MGAGGGNLASGNVCGGGLIWRVAMCTGDTRLASASKGKFLTPAGFFLL